MGVKDIEEKQFEDYNDVFADIVNVLIFGGKQIVKPRVKHVDAVLKLMTALTGDPGFEDIINETSAEGRRSMTMCEVLDKARKEGKFELIVQIVNNYIAKKNLTQKAACEDLSIKYSEYMAAKRYMKKIGAQS